MKRSVGGRFATDFFAFDQRPDQLWRVGQKVEEPEIRFASYLRHHVARTKPTTRIDDPYISAGAAMAERFRFRQRHRDASRRAASTAAALPVKPPPMMTRSASTPDLSRDAHTVMELLARIDCRLTWLS